MDDLCPHCGATLMRRAAFCRECGSDAATGWNADAELGGVDLPTDWNDAEYERFLERELGEVAAGHVRRHTRRTLWRLLVALVLLGLLFFAVVRL